MKNQNTRTYEEKGFEHGVAAASGDWTQVASDHWQQGYWEFLVYNEPENFHSYRQGFRDGVSRIINSSPS